MCKTRVLAGVVSVRAANLGLVMTAHSSGRGVVEYRGSTEHRPWPSTLRPDNAPDTEPTLNPVDQQTLVDRVAHLQRQTERLQQAVLSNRAIGLALGVLATDRRISYLQAHDLLRAASRRSGRTVRDVAAEVSFSGVLARPEAPSCPHADRSQSPHRPRTHRRPAWQRHPTVMPGCSPHRMRR